MSFQLQPDFSSDAFDEMEHLIDMCDEERVLKINLKTPNH